MKGDPAYIPSEEDYNKLEEIFRYHAPVGNQPERYEYIRDEARNLAHIILSMSPKSREQSLAITSLQQAVMWANSAIAINESNKSGE